MEVERRAGGKLSHARGPATANARSPMDARRVDGTTKSEVDAERSRRRAALATDTVRSDKYPGAASFKQPCTSIQHYTGCVVVPAASLSPSEAVSREGRLSCEFTWMGLPYIAILLSTRTKKVTNPSTHRN